MKNATPQPRSRVRIFEPNLTLGLDLRYRANCCCVLDETQLLWNKRVSSTPKLCEPHKTVIERLNGRSGDPLPDPRMKP